MTTDQAHDQIPTLTEQMIANGRTIRKNVKKLEMYLLVLVGICLANLVFRNAETMWDYVFKVGGAVFLIIYHIAVRRWARALPPPRRGAGSSMAGRAGGNTTSKVF